MQGNPSDPPVPLPATPVLRPDAELAQAAQIEGFIADKLRYNIETLLQPGLETIQSCGQKIAQAVDETLRAVEVAYGDLFPQIESRLFAILGTAGSIASGLGCGVESQADLVSSGYTAPPPLPSLLPGTITAEVSGQGGLQAFPIPHGGGIGDNPPGAPAAVPADEDDEFEIELKPDQPVKPQGQQGGIGPIQPLQPVGQGGIGPLPVRPGTPPAGWRPGGAASGSGTSGGTPNTRPVRPGGPSGAGSGDSGAQPVSPTGQTQGGPQRPTGQSVKPPRPGGSRPPAGAPQTPDGLPPEGGLPPDGGSGEIGEVAFPGEDGGATEPDPFTVTFHQEDGDVTVNVNVEQHCEAGEDDEDDEDEDDEDDEDDEEYEEYEEE